MRSLLMFFIFMISIEVQAADKSSLSCLFENFIQVKHKLPSTVENAEIQQSMKIVDGRTDELTLKLDGSKRATNSRTWTTIPLDGWETWETKFLGDFREILSLAHDLGANKKPLRGWYKASLVSTNLDETHISLGNCLVE